jgi:hypothetical protein
MNVETKAESEAARWQDQVYDLLRRYNVTQFAYVPDAGHRILIDRSLADPQVHSVALTTEEEGVALLAGADLGARAASCCCKAAASATASTCCRSQAAGDFRCWRSSACAVISAREIPGNIRWGGQPSRCWKRWAPSV